MAITRTQIAKQLLANGGRIGFRVGTEGTGMPEGEGPGGTIGGPNIGASLHGNDKPNFIKKKKIITSSSGNGGGNGDKKVSPIEKFNAFQKQKFTPLRKNTLRNLIDYIGGGRKFQYPTASIFRDLTGKGLKMDVSDYEGLENVSPLQLQAMFGKDIIGTADEEKIRDISRVLGQDVVSQSDFEQFYPDKTLTGDGSNDPCDGPNPPAYCFTGIRSAAIEPEIEPEEQEPFELARAFRAKGGRIGLFKGAQEDASAGKGAMSPGTDTGGGLRGENGDQSPKIITPSGGGGDEPDTLIKANPKFNFGVNIGKGLPPNELARLFSEFYGLSNTEDESPQVITAGDGVNIYPTSGEFLDPKLDEKKQARIFEEYRAEGGIMDGNIDEMGRQMYGLGKLVKKVTRGIKKIAKSPIGKAALLYGGFKGFQALGGAKGIMGSLFGQAGSRVGQPFVPFKEGLLTKLGLTKGGGSLMPTALGGIGLASLASGLMTKQTEEDEEDELYRGEGLDFASLRPYGIQRFAEGGKPEPVAKKTMPLLKMGGMEKDYREDGGFVPIGRMEKADDVPARLSKNEFVFTADAVRNAGEGDVDKGAEVMYNMMKNLESGGDVSEESQGLEGARKMFQTSQRLEEVL